MLSCAVWRVTSRCKCFKKRLRQPFWFVFFLPFPLFSLPDCRRSLLLAAIRYIPSRCVLLCVHVAVHDAAALSAAAPAAAAGADASRSQRSESARWRSAPPDSRSVAMRCVQCTVRSRCWDTCWRAAGDGAVTMDDDNHSPAARSACPRPAAAAAAAAACCSDGEPGRADRSRLHSALLHGVRQGSQPAAAPLRQSRTGAEECEATRRDCWLPVDPLGSPARSVLSLASLVLSFPLSNPPLC